MSKKRKTRKQKEKSLERKESTNQSSTVQPLTYSVSDIGKSQIIKPKETINDKMSIVEKNYLKQDIAKIVTASGLVFAFDILLFTLISKGIINLSMFGF